MPSYTKIDESYEKDHFPEIKKEEINENKLDSKNILSKDSDEISKNKNIKAPQSESSNDTPEILASVEISDGANKKPFRSLGLLNKSQLKLASYIKANKNVTLEGTKRFMDKSGEYYLKNIQLQNKKKDKKRKALNKPQNLENCLNYKDIKKKASKIVTLLPENSLTPIPKKKDVKDNSLANGFGKKELNDAQRTAVFIRRLEYSTSMKRQINEDKNIKDQMKKIALLQEWWKAMFKIIKLQKNLRGFLFRKKLMNNLEHQEKLLQFITEFDNIHSYHLYKQFFDNLKKKRDYENSKLMEKCEDFNEKLDNLEKLHNYNNFKNCFKKWKEDTQKQKKEDLNNLIKKLDDILSKKNIEDKKEAFDNIKLKENEEENKLNDKINNFRQKQAEKKFWNEIIRPHKLNKILNNIRNNLDKKNLENALDEIKNKSNEEMVRNAFNKWKKLNDENKKRNKIINKLKRYKENIERKKKEEENKKLIISNINNIELISDKKNENNEDNNQENQIFISRQNEINILMEPQKKLILTKNHQNFALLVKENEKINFNFNEPLEKNNNLDKIKISCQLEDIDTFLENKNKTKIIGLKSTLEKIEKPKTEQEDDSDKLKQNQNIEDGAEKAEKIINNNLKKNALENLKDYADKIKEIQNIENGMEKAENIMNNNLKKNAFEKLKDYADKINEIQNIENGIKKTENIMNNNLKKNAFEKLKNFNKINIITKFNLLQKYFKKDNLEEKENTEDKKENQIEDKLNNNDNEPIKDILIRKNILFKLKKEDDKTENDKKEDNKKEDNKKEDNKKEDDKKEESRKKRISHRKSPKKNSLRKKKSKKKNLKKAFDKWKRYSFSSDTKDDLINKYKNKVLQDLLKVYKKNKKNSLLRNYFDKWKNKEQAKEEEEEKEILKYKKKPKILDNKDIIEEDKEQEFIKENDNDTFRPVYILSKKNLYNNVLLNQNPNIDESIHESYDSNTNNLNKNNAPYIKKYGQRNFNKKNKNISNNQNDKEYEQISDDTSSNEGSILSGISLIQKKEEIKEPRNYTSQSYFIDTNNKKDITQNEIYKINKIPNVMKGDFDNFIENNPNILCNKNPRIQITSSTYDIDELNNVDNNKYDINNTIIQKCDYDLYANQKSKSKRDKWYSMSIPLNKAYKYNNKNEMIKKNENDRINYKLQEMNASQFYKSPNRRIYKNKFEDKFIIPGKNRRNMNKSLSPFNRYNRNNEINNKIEFDRNNKWQKSNINY